jgi:hypothetical protein
LALAAPRPSTRGSVSKIDYRSTKETTHQSKLSTQLPRSRAAKYLSVRLAIFVALPWRALGCVTRWVVAVYRKSSSSSPLRQAWRHVPLIRTEAVTDISLRFYSFHLRFLSSQSGERFWSVERGRAAHISREAPFCAASSRYRSMSSSSPRPESMMVTCGAVRRQPSTGGTRTRTHRVLGCRARNALGTATQYTSGIGTACAPPNHRVQPLRARTVGRAAEIAPSAWYAAVLASSPRSPSSPSSPGPSAVCSVPRGGCPAAGGSAPSSAQRCRFVVLACGGAPADDPAAAPISGWRAILVAIAAAPRLRSSPAVASQCFLTRTHAT